MIRQIIICAMFLLSTNQVSARTWHLNNSGTGDAPTIAAALDSSMAGDRIELEGGIYTESRLQMKSAVTLCSSTGTPHSVTIDGSSPPLAPGPVISCNYSGDDTLIEGLTITGGMATDWLHGQHGGGLSIAFGAGPRVERCIIIGNYARVGGGVSVSQSQPTFVDCEISDNDALTGSGGVSIVGESVFTAVRTSIMENMGSDGVLNDDCSANFYCCDLALGNWLLYGSHVIDDSDCDPVSTERHSLVSLKALFR